MEKTTWFNELVDDVKWNAKTLEAMSAGTEINLEVLANVLISLMNCAEYGWTNMFDQTVKKSKG